MSISISSKTQNITNNKEYRCPKCYLIPFINIFSDENKLFMSTKCTNNHNYTKPFDEMEKMIKTNLISNYSCVLCEKENNKKNFNIFYYCSNCYNFYCSKHGETHKLKENHKIFLSKNFDSVCTEHNRISVIGYCKYHNKNYCKQCEHYNENNKKLDENLNDSQINYYEREMKKNEEIINEIESMFNYYKKLFKDLEYNFNIFKENKKKIL